MTKTGSLGPVEYCCWVSSKRRGEEERWSENEEGWVMREFVDRSQATTTSPALLSRRRPPPPFDYHHNYDSHTSLHVTSLNCWIDVVDHVPNHGWIDMLPFILRSSTLPPSAQLRTSPPSPNAISGKRVGFALISWTLTWVFAIFACCNWNLTSFL